MFIDGTRTWAASGSTFEAIDPSIGRSFAAVALANAADVDAAVRASRQAIDGGWSGLPPVRRVRILNRLAALIRERATELAELESLDVGKPLRQARDDVTAAAGYFEFFAGVADKVFGSSIPLGAGLVDFTLRESLGISAQIVPWNYPLRLASRGIAPALACGNAVVATPSAEAGLSVVRLAELAVEAGLPGGVFNVVTGGRETGAALTAHSDINHITFTGSVPTGITIMKAAADHVVEDPGMGAVGSGRQVQRVLDFIDAGARDGARAVTGGARATGRDLAGGYFIEPTLLDDVVPGTRLEQEEIFGPVLTVTTFNSTEEAIAIANGTPYGLVTGIWTRDLARALAVATAVKSGQVRINGYSAEGSIRLPSGGYKRSGFGREQGVEALASYTQIKNVMINFGEPTS